MEADDDEQRRQHPAAISFQFDDEDDVDADAADYAAASALANIVAEQAEEPPLPAFVPELLPVPPLKSSAAAAASATAAPKLADTGELDFNFLQTLSNPRKLKKARAERSETLGENEDIDMYREDPETERQQIERIHRLREEAARDDNEEEPLRFGEPSSAPPPGLVEFFKDDLSHHSGSSGGGGGGGRKKKKNKSSSKSKSKSKSRHHHDDEDREEEERDEDYDREIAPYEERPVFKPRRSKAEMWAEERGHKAKCVARIEQLEAKGIACSLPEEIDWMSLPLAQLDDELTLMETKYKRKGKIVKMRAGFYALNKALTWGLTSHPGKLRAR